LYALLTDTSPGATQSMSASEGKQIPILQGLKFIIFLLHHQEYVGVTLDDRG
jgi:hypothetical protein